MENELTIADRQWVKAVLELVDESVSQGRHPFAALVVDAQGAVLSRAINNSLPPTGDPTSHAELAAAAAAARALGGAGGLSGATLYSSAEPCAMCAGAIYWCGIGRVVFVLSEKELKACTGDHPENPTLDLPCQRVFAAGQRPTVVVGPIPEFHAAAIQPHLTFWK